MTEKLNKTLRDGILQNVLNEAFDHRRKKLAKREAELAERVRERSLGEHKTTYESLPKELRTMEHDWAMVEIGGQRHRLQGQEGLSAPWCPLKLAVDSSLAHDIQQLARQKSQIADECRELRAHVWGVLNSVTTVKKLLEIWPELQTHLPKTQRQSQELVSVEKVKRELAEAARKE